MTKIYRAQQVYELDRKAIELDDISGRSLMLSAAQSVWREVLQRWPAVRSIAVFAGAGNNGGDAFALAGLAHKQGIDVTLFMFGETTRQSTESAFYRDQWFDAGGAISEWRGDCPAVDLIIDGLLGIGISKPLDQSWQSLIRSLNAAPARRVAIDLPSGLNADTGCPMPIAVEADLTVSFIGRKLGCYLADGPDYCGDRVFAPLGLSSSTAATVPAACRTLSPGSVAMPPPRLSNTHKNHYGHVLVVGGDRGMGGAVCLAARAALRTGSGLVSACVQADNYPIVAACAPEIMVNDWGKLDAMLARASFVVVGPGLGTTAAAQQVLQQLKRSALPMVVDADALHADFLDAVGDRACVITPHPGEAARLLQQDSAAIQADRLQALSALTQRWPAVCVLKGSGTLVGAAAQQNWISLLGHAGMATAGAGDVLSGMIGSLLGQGLTPYQAAKSGVYLHARAADLYAETQAPASLVAGDLVAGIGSVLQELQPPWQSHGVD